ncbi:MAG: dephospho-CoA kinase [Synergistales bacterium]|nr:dephospho-CoA kinase [Synergistales bacterium]MDY6404681.1 dephospho-CoA kinase [Synergistales bacterium]MDY6410903.1 dephospho-CoA kinase [Synergistales bacterium]MDY6415126.1 dephospho-CoA kinase [Synergistales bacterium]MDY6422411.1 dephospho-CoA kinase [Synergistales bacterium]
MAVAAITGDIGAGKSTVSKLLAEKFSCPLLNADLIAAELWHDEKVKNIFISRWGEKILDTSGNIIKSEISRRIFFDPDEYKFCNSILHPLIIKDLGVRSEELGVKSKNIFLEIPLLFEAGVPDFVEKIIYVAADFDIRAKRCFIQRGWSVDELKRRESFLLPREKKISLSGYVIENNDGLEELKKELRILIPNS